MYVPKFCISKRWVTKFSIFNGRESQILVFQKDEWQTLVFPKGISDKTLYFERVPNDYVFLKGMSPNVWYFTRLSVPNFTSIFKEYESRSLEFQKGLNPKFGILQVRESQSLVCLKVASQSFFKKGSSPKFSYFKKAGGKDWYFKRA